MLKVGDKAPNFTLPDQDENHVSLTNFKDKKIVLWFYPKASTPGWTIEGKGFRDEFQKFDENNLKILGCSADPIKKQKKFCDKHSFKYPLLSDESHEMLEKYDLSINKVEKIISIFSNIGVLTKMMYLQTTGFIMDL